MHYNIYVCSPVTLSRSRLYKHFFYRIFLFWFVFMMKVTWAFSLLNFIQGLDVSGYGFMLSASLHLPKILYYKDPRFQKLQIYMSEKCLLALKHIPGVKRSQGLQMFYISFMVIEGSQISRFELGKVRMLVLQSSLPLHLGKHFVR